MCSASPPCSWSRNGKSARRGYNPNHVWNALLLVGALALIGGRLYHVIDQWGALYSQDPLRAILPPYAGLGLYGGVAGAALGLSIYTRWKKLPLPISLDVVIVGALSRRASRAGATSSTRSCTARRPTCRGASRSTAPTASPSGRALCSRRPRPASSRSSCTSRSSTSLAVWSRCTSRAASWRGCSRATSPRSGASGTARRERCWRPSAPAGTGRSAAFPRRRSSALP